LPKETKRELIPAFWKDDSYYILDQLKLPESEEYIKADDIETLFNAIKDMNLRGAPLIGVSASAGIVLGMKDWDEVSDENFQIDYDYLMKSRPTAVNLTC